MDDADVLKRIGACMDEERALHGGGELSGTEAEHLGKLEVTVDRLWDYLRQRRAARAAGRDPDTVEIRSEGTVESYLQ